MHRLGFYGFIVILACSLSGMNYQELSSLEKSVADEGLHHFHLTPAHNPEGKSIRTIYIFTSKPFSKDTEFLTVFNNLHVVTKPSVIKQQLTIKEGEIYDEALVHESALIMRGYGLVRSLAVIIPCHGKGLKPHQIDLLVATKDLMSLQPNFSVSGSGFGSDFLMTNLVLGLSEHNFLGYNKSISGIYELQQGAHLASLRYLDPNLFSSPWQLLVKPSILWTRDTLKFDGFLGDFKLEKPLLSEKDRWGYGLEASYGMRSIIDFNGSKIRTFEIKGHNGSNIVDRKYRWRYTKGSLFGRYSRGRTHKKEIFFGYHINVKRPSIFEGLNLSPEQRDYFIKHVLPRDERESYFKLGFSYFQNRFLTLYDYDNYRLEETIRLGPHLSLSNDFASKPVLFGDHSFLRPETRVSLTHNLGPDAFFNVFAATSNRFDGSFNDNLFKFGASCISPKLFGIGRAVFEGRLSLVFDNRDNQQFALGSESGLRGVESRFYVGDKAFRTNLEYRSSPLDIWIFHGGLVLFYDVGSAFNTWAEANATHALGFGIRILAPQISSIPFRLDLAFPIYGVGLKNHRILPSFGTGQAF